MKTPLKYNSNVFFFFFFFCDNSFHSPESQQSMDKQTLFFTAWCTIRCTAIAKFIFFFLSFSFSRFSSFLFQNAAGTTSGDGKSQKLILFQLFNIYVDLVFIKIFERDKRISFIFFLLLLHVAFCCFFTFCAVYN